MLFLLEFGIIILLNPIRGIKMTLHTKISFAEIQERCTEIDNPGTVFWLKRIVDTVRYIFTSQGRAFGLASATVAVAVALGAGAALATAIAAPAVILPLVGVGVGIGIYRQYKRHNRLKTLSANLKVSRKGLQDRIDTLITERKIAYGLEYVFEPYEGYDIHEKLQNIFGTEYEALKYEEWTNQYNLMLKRREVLSTFFEKYGKQKIEDAHEQQQINKLIDSLDEFEYREFQGSINTFFYSGNNAWLHDRELVGPKKASLHDLAPEINPELEKRWYHYVIEAARDLIAAIVSVGTVFGLIAGIAVIAGVTIGTGGIGLVVLIVAAVVGVSVGIGLFAVKKYIHEKEKSDVNNFDNVNDTNNKIVHTMNDIHIRNNEKTFEQYFGHDVNSTFLENFEAEFALSESKVAELVHLDSTPYSAPLGNSLKRSNRLDDSSVNDSSVSHVELDMDSDSENTKSPQ